MFDEYTSLEDCEKKLEKFENTRKTTKAGFKQWYKCKFCDKRAYILFHRQNMSVSLYVEECAHKEHQRNDFFIDKKTKQKVLDLSVNYKTKYIGQWLRDNINEGYDELNDSQISNILSRKNNTEHSSKITLADLQKWCDQKKNVPQDPDEMFSAEFDFNLFQL